MDRRAVLGGGVTIIAAAVSGCLEYFVGEDGPFDKPGARGGSWDATAVAEANGAGDLLEKHREAVDELAFASLILEGEHADRESLVDLAPIEDTSIPPPTVGLITTEDELASISIEAEAIVGGSAAHVYDEPSALLDDTKLDVSYVLIIEQPGTVSENPLNLELVGTLPGSIAYAELRGDSVSEGADQSYLTLVRVGAWTPPAGLIVGIQSSGSSGNTAGLFEYPENT